MSVESSISMWLQNDPSEYLYVASQRIIREAVENIGCDVSAIGAQIAEELIFPAIDEHQGAGALLKEIITYADWSEIIGDDIDTAQKEKEKREEEEENACGDCDEPLDECTCDEVCEECESPTDECTCDDAEES